MKKKPTEFIPRPGQQELINHLIENKRSAIYATVGAGKTVNGLTVLTTLELIEDVLPALIVGPKPVLEAVWVAETQKFSHTKGLRCQVISGSQNQRLAQMRADADIHLINYENLDWLLTELRRARGGVKWKTLILDESVKIKGFRRSGGTKQGRAAVLLSMAIDRVHLLSGLPAPNSIEDLWAQTYALDKGAALGDTIDEFRTTYMKQIRQGKDTDSGKKKFGGKWVPTKNALEKIKDRIRHMCYFDDVLKREAVPDPYIIDTPVELPHAIRKVYTNIETGVFDEDVRPETAVMRSSSLIQVAAGFQYVEGGPTIWHHEAKMDALEGIMEGAPDENIIVAYLYKAQLEQMRRRFGKAVVELRDGGNILDNVAKWNVGKIKLLAIQPASAAEGLNLQQGGRRIVWLTAGYNLSHWVQLNGRVSPLRQKQAGLNRDVYIHRLTCVDTIDEVFPGVLEGKAAVNDMLFSYAKERREALSLADALG